MISDWRISRLKTSGTSPGVSVVQANAGMPVSNENVRGRKRRIADGEEIEKERVSYYRDNWRDFSGQSEEGGKKGEMEARTRHPKTGSVIPEIGTWNADPRQRLFPLSDFAFVSPVCLFPSLSLSLSPYL